MGTARKWEIINTKYYFKEEKKTAGVASRISATVYE